MKAFCNLWFIILIITLSSTNQKTINEVVPSSNKELLSIIKSIEEESLNNPYHLFVQIFTPESNINIHRIDEIISILNHSSSVYIQMNKYSIKEIKKDMIILIRNGQIIYQNRRIAESTIDPIIIANCIKNFAHSNVNEFFLQFTSMEKNKSHKEKNNTKEKSTKEDEKLIEEKVNEENNQDETVQNEKPITFIETNQTTTTTDSLPSNDKKKLYKAVCAVVISTVVLLVVIFIVKASVDYATNCRTEINKSEEEEKIKLSQKMLGDYEIYSILS